MIFKDLSIYVNMIIAVLLIYVLFELKVENKKIKKFDTYLGQYSYPIYLSHFLVALIYAALIGYGVIENSFKLDSKAIIPYFITLLIFNILVVHLIDINVNKLKKKINIKKGT